MSAGIQILKFPPEGVFLHLLNQVTETIVHHRPGIQVETRDKDALADEALVKSIVNGGNQIHFQTLLARYKVKVHHIALSILGPSQQAQAEDVAQEIFIKLYQRLDSFRGDCRFSTWLYRLAINAAIDFQRKNRKFEADDIDRLVIPGTATNIESEIEAGETSVKVQEAIATLPQTQRMMVYLFYWLGFRIREIAEVMDCPQGTVKVYLSRAKQHLAVELEGILDE